MVGNSVARVNSFGTSRALLAALGAAFPGTEFSQPQYARGVAGGFEPSHLMHCGASAYAGADVVLVQYAGLGRKESSAALLDALLAAPGPPLVLVVKHCEVPQVRSAASNHLQAQRLGSSSWSACTARRIPCAVLNAAPSCLPCTGAGPGAGKRARQRVVCPLQVPRRGSHVCPHEGERQAGHGAHCGGQRHHD